MDSADRTRRARITFISSNNVWGGSEELWSATAAVLAEAGHQVAVFKPGIPESEPRIRRLRELSCRIRDIRRFPFLTNRLALRFAYLSHRLSAGLQLTGLRVGLAAAPRPDLVVVSQGGNYDGLYVADVCRRMKLPYVLICQKAGDLYWPVHKHRERMRKVYQEARACYFVSEHNRRLTEEQFEIELPDAAIVRNPFLVPWEPRNDWPSETDGLRLACIGRLYPAEKGQDLVLRVLARDHWRKRPLSVTFYGDGEHRTALEGMVRHARLTSVTFAGFTRDVAAIWDDHHGLILPSRCEGLPLVLVEAMMSGRVPIATDVAGHAEVVEDGVTGFLATAPTEDALDAAMERAWGRREEWREIGRVAATRIRELVPRDPAAELAKLVLQVRVR